MSHNHHLVGLYDLRHETLLRLQVPRRTRLVGRLQKDHVVRLRQDDTRKQIRDDALEQGHVVVEKLRQINIRQRSAEVKTLDELWEIDFPYLKRRMSSFSSGNARLMLPQADRTDLTALIP